MKMVLPREHGSWGILFAPLLVGTFSAGAEWHHLLLFSGALSAFLAANPLIQWLKNPQKNRTMVRWMIGYGIAALLFGVPLLLVYRPLLWIAAGACLTLGVNILFAVNRRERHLLNDAAAIFGLSLGGVAAYFVGAQSLTVDALWVALASLLFFFGSALHVKTLIREKGNLAYKRAADWYHLFLLVGAMTSAAVYPELFHSPWLWLAYLGSALRTWLTPFNSNMRPSTAGMLEIVNTIWFVIAASLAIG